MRSIRMATALATCFAAVGCQSALIQATVSNHRTTPVSLVEVDYPSASFGIQTLAPGEDYHYRFKVIGDGAVTVQWTDGRDQKKTTGPVLRDGDAGTLDVTFTTTATPTWDAKLSNRTIR